MPCATPALPLVSERSRRSTASPLPAGRPARATSPPETPDWTKRNSKRISRTGPRVSSSRGRACARGRGEVGLERLPERLRRRLPELRLAEADAVRQDLRGRRRRIARVDQAHRALDAPGRLDQVVHLVRIEVDRPGVRECEQRERRDETDRNDDACRLLEPLARCYVDARRPPSPTSRYTPEMTGACSGAGTANRSTISPSVPFKSRRRCRDGLASEIPGLAGDSREWCRAGGGAVGQAGCGS